MSFPAQVADKQKQDCLQKCFYMMNLIRNKSPEIWEMYQPVYATLKPEESWEFYHVLIEEYQKLIAPPVAIKKKAVKKTAKKAAAPKKKAPAAKKKPVAKKVAKKKA